VQPQLFRQIFINEKRPFNALSNDTVLAFLKPHGIAIERDYLDFIINTCKNPNPTYHMLLANLLLQQILPLLQQVRNEFLSFSFFLSALNLNEISKQFQLLRAFSLYLFILFNACSHLDQP
jgi:hypothetical protein